MLIGQIMIMGIIVCFFIILPYLIYKIFTRKNISEKGLRKMNCFLMFMAILVLLLLLFLFVFFEEYQLPITIFTNFLSIKMLFITYNKERKDFFFKKIKKEIEFRYVFVIKTIFLGAIITYLLYFIITKYNIVKNLVNITTLVLALFPYGYMLLKEYKEYN